MLHNKLESNLSKSNKEVTGKKQKARKKKSEPVWGEDSISIFTRWKKKKGKRENKRCGLAQCSVDQCVLVTEVRLPTVFY